MMIFQILALVALFLAAVSADGNFDENDKFSSPLSERDMVLGTSMKKMNHSLTMKTRFTDSLFFIFSEIERYHWWPLHLRHQLPSLLRYWV